ncbi:recombinase family protein [Oerskovia sp. KBS0722]|uniref:recombinase family protein n=1 Tax=Oerskovia sp. KBS0722 TaxID=1179673 RepID=UPI00110F0567|nr:recombinase family protein [Oerskovia sp. KBS0722]
MMACPRSGRVVRKRRWVETATVLTHPRACARGASTRRSLSEADRHEHVAGRVMVHMLAALAQMEADFIRERTLDGLAAARSRGRVGGRPTVMSPERLATARASVSGGQSVASVAWALGVPVSTVRRRLAQHG